MGVFFKIVKIKKVYMQDVVHLLNKYVSKFLPVLDDMDKIWFDFSRQKHVHGVVLIENKSVVGYGSVLIASRIRGGAVAYIEDVVVDEKCRYLGYGKAIVLALMDLAGKHGCYKISLECRPESMEFYEHCQFSRSKNIMCHFISLNNSTSSK
jgi:GNAT superfamily N-acetyltransferase